MLKDDAALVLRDGPLTRKEEIEQRKAQDRLASHVARYPFDPELLFDDTPVDEAWITTAGFSRPDTDSFYLMSIEGVVLKWDGFNVTDGNYDTLLCSPTRGKLARLLWGLGMEVRP